MYCPKCGSKNKEGVKFCSKCGSEIKEDIVNVSTSNEHSGLKALSIVGFILSILLFPIGLILSIIGLAKCNKIKKQTGEKLSFNAFNIAGLIISIFELFITLLVVVIIVFVFGILNLSKSAFEGEWDCTVPYTSSRIPVVTAKFTDNNITWGKYNDLENNSLYGAYKLNSFENTNNKKEYKLTITPEYMVEDGKNSNRYASSVTMNLELEGDSMVVTTSQTSLKYYCTRSNR